MKPLIHDFCRYLGVAGLLLINFALNQAPVEGWHKSYIPVLLGVGLLHMVYFVYIELQVATRPIVPLKDLRKDAVLAIACITCGWASHGIWSYYLFLLIESIRGHPPLVAALQTWPVAPIGFCAALAVPFLLRKIKVAYVRVHAVAYCLAFC